jgi:hypothetical protein
MKAVPASLTTDTVTETGWSVSHRTANFVVYAPTLTMARALAAEAEYQRVTLAKQWIGQELPQSEDRCVIRYTPQVGAPVGENTFAFRNGKERLPGLSTAQIELRGEFLTILTNVLPHEVVQLVLATHFGKQVPRWANAGIAVTAEDVDSQSSQDELSRKLLNEGRGIRLKVLFRMTEYPKDMLALYSQGHSVVRFLLSRPVTVGPAAQKSLPHLGELVRTVANPQQQLIIFLRLGLDENTAESWDRAAKSVYGFESLNALEEAWLKYLEKPESRLRRSEVSPPKKQLDEKPDFIPPTRLPGEPR